MRDSSIQIFAHIPKTAGSTLVQVMRRQFRPEEILSYEDRHWAVSVRGFPARAAAGLQGIRCVMGHIPFGVHGAPNGDVKYLTMLRDPVEWTLSMFSYIKERHGRLPDDPRYPQRAAFADVPRMSLEGFVEFLQGRGMANFQTRYVSGYLDLQNPLPPHENMPPNALELAKANLLAPQTTFGIVEHFDLSLLLFKKRLGWKNVYYQNVNVTEHKVARTQVPAPTLARIQELHKEDGQLYEMAMNEFRKLLAQAGLDEPLVLYQFRAANAGYGLLMGGAGRLRRLVGRMLDVLGLRRANR
jgi:hypothetical protein